MSLLKNLLVDTKSAWVEYPGMRGFEVEIANIPRAQLIKLRKACMITKFDRKSKQPIETLDEDKFVQKFTEAAVKNWKGFKFEHLEQLALVDIGDKDLNEEIPFSPEDAEMLVSNSADFDSWLNEAVFDLENFRSSGEGRAVESAS